MRRRFPVRCGLAGLYAACVGVMLPAVTAATAPPPPPPSERIVIAYVEPTNPAHKPLYDLLKENGALERVKRILEPIRWPRPLRLELKGCDGESNAFYEDAVVTVCYEYVDEVWKNANASKRPAMITREEAFVGPLSDTFLHEAAHAMFDLLKIPVFGREEDAADQIAAYSTLQLPKERKLPLIMGTAFAYASELKISSPRGLTRPRLRIGRHVTYADEHGTPAQRLYNLLCIAYGSDKELFADVVKLGYLPSERAEMCEDEYRQVDFAYRQLIAPLVGPDPAETSLPKP